MQYCNKKNTTIIHFEIWLNGIPVIDVPQYTIIQLGIYCSRTQYLHFAEVAMWCVWAHNLIGAFRINVESDFNS